MLGCGRSPAGLTMEVGSAYSSHKELSYCSLHLVVLPFADLAPDEWVITSIQPPGLMKMSLRLSHHHQEHQALPQETQNSP